MSAWSQMNRSFVLLKADWDIEKAKPILESLPTTHVIVHRRGSDLYYLYLKSEILHLLKKWPTATILHKALDLHEDERTPTFQASATGVLEGPAVIVDERHVTGFIDVVSKGIRSIAPRREEISPFNLSADFPEEVKLGTPALLSLTMSIERTGRASMPVDLSRNSKIDLLVQPKEGFELDGPAEGTIVVKDNPVPARFKLKAIEFCKGRIHIFAFHRGQALGLLKLSSYVVKGSVRSGKPRTFKKEIVPPVPNPPADLSLMIFEQELAGSPALMFRLSSADPTLKLNLKKFEPISLKVDPLQYFEEFFQDIEKLPLGSDKERVLAEKHLAAKGMNLFKAVVPKELQVLMWSLKDRIKSIQIQSEEPWIPWELCKLKGADNGRIVEGPFLCEGYAVTRWLPEVGFKPKLTAKKIGVVVPADSGLPYADDEKKFLISLAKKNRSIEEVPANVVELTTALSEGDYDVWHFSGHGGFRNPDPDLSGMLLEDRETLTPEHISGVVENLGLSHPLVFLNACQIGRSAMSLTGIGGWASKFLQAEAGAFIGAYWSVFDKPAYTFAKELYSRLFSGVPMGRAAKEARLAIRPLGDPTWLAYTVFADPLAIVA